MDLESLIPDLSLVKLETTEERRRTLTEERTNNAAPARRLGSVSEALNGRCLEFRSHSTIPGSDVTPCNQTDGCSPAPMSQPLGTNHAPWTFWATNYTVLTVMEGYYSGESVYHVWDRNASLGNTSRGQPGILCDDDPIECFGDPNVGRGQWILAPGWHSLRITVEYQEYWGDYGWFRLSTNDALLVNATLPAPFNSTVTLPPRVCGSTQAPCSKQTTCCTGLVCRRRPSNPKGNPTCRKCSKRRRRCLKNMDCCGSRPLPVAIPSVASEASSTQSNGTVGQEKRFRVCRRSVMTGPGTCQSCLRQGSHCLHNNDCCSRRCTGATPSTTFCRPARAP